MRIRTLMAAAAALSLTAAGVHAAEIKPAPSPALQGPFVEAQPEHSGGEPRTDWWAALSDPLLDQLVAGALRDNRDLKAAEADVRRARALAKVEGWSLLPSGGLSVGQGRSRDAVLDQEGDYASVGGDIAWEVDLFGRLRSGVAAARADALGVEEARRGVMAAIAAQTASTYVDLRGAQARLQAGQANAKAQGETLRLTEVLRDAGRSTPLDVMRARAQREATEAALPLLQAQIEGDLAALDVLAAGLSPDLAAALKTPGPALTPPDMFSIGWPDELLHRRPDIREGEARLQAAQARVRGAKVDWWPRLSFLGSATAAGLDFGSLSGSSALSFNIGPRIDWPALDFRRNALRTEAARAGADAEYQRYEKVVLAGVRDVDTSLANLTGARRAEARLADAADAARQAAGVSRLRYREGIDAFFTVLDAERSLATAEDSLAVARTRSALAYIRLGQALGVGWSDDPAPSVMASRQ